MKKFPLFAAALFLLSSLTGCAQMMSGLSSHSYRDAPLVLAYSGPEVIRDQAAVATLIVPVQYSMAVDGLPVKELEGPFNPALRVSRVGVVSAYIVDLLPGSRELTVTYDAMQGSENAKAGTELYSSGSTKVSGSASYGGRLFSWIRTSETRHTLKGGEIYVIGLELFTITGNIDLYPLEDEGDRLVVIETRNRAEFPEPDEPAGARE